MRITTEPLSRTLTLTDVEWRVIISALHEAAISYMEDSGLALASCDAPLASHLSEQATDALSLAETLEEVTR